MGNNYIGNNCMHMRLDMRMNMCMAVCMGMCIGMHTDMCTDIRVAMRVDMCRFTKQSKDDQAVTRDMTATCKPKQTPGPD